MLDHCTAIDAVLARGRVGETYHVGSGVEASIMEVADRILAALGKPESLKTIVPDRPGHDRRYVLDSSKLRTELGWAPSIEWEQGLADTVAWYAEHRDWWEPLRARAPVAEGAWGTGRAEPVRILITGADGQLGRDLRDCLAGRVPAAAGVRPARPRGAAAGARPRGAGDRHRRHAGRRPGRRPAHVPAFRPELVLHGGALTAVDLCETEVDLAFAVNAMGTRHVAEAAALVGAHLVYVSTDYVFDGTATRPYREWDRPNPASVYGASKLAGERECRPGSTIVRTTWVCGAHGANMVVTALRLAAADGRAALRRRSARVAHLHRRPGAGPRHPGPGPAARAPST